MPCVISIERRRKDVEQLRNSPILRAMTIIMGVDLREHHQDCQGDKEQPEKDFAGEQIDSGQPDGFQNGNSGIGHNKHAD